MTTTKTSIIIVALDNYGLLEKLHFVGCNTYKYIFTFPLLWKQRTLAPES